MYVPIMHGRMHMHRASQTPVHSPSCGKATLTTLCAVNHANTHGRLYNEYPCVHAARTKTRKHTDIPCPQFHVISLSAIAIIDNLFFLI